ncbi:MAG: 6-phosphofructokinase [Chloroflexi bacterium]|nr:6-phosphofructokinase [Chloroflexota bacterium]
MKTLVVVSGGDAPGINAFLYHLCEQAHAAGDTLIGALGGFRALLDEELVPLNSATVAPYMAIGGSYLPSSRDPVLSEGSNRQALDNVLIKHHIDNVLLFGGNGSLRYLPPILQEIGVPCVGVPTTIDNDVAGTERTLGFDSACQYAYHAIDGVRATGHALAGRFFTLETLGGHTGMLALAVAEGAGADVVLVPEYPIDDEPYFVERLKAALKRKGHALLVYTEFVPDKDAVLASLAGKVGARLRETRLGHAQRGGAPSHSDRVLARDWARLAYPALQEGAAAITIWKNGRPALHHGLLATDVTPLPDRTLYNQINGLDGER